MPSSHGCVAPSGQYLNCCFKGGIWGSPSLLGKESWSFTQRIHMKATRNPHENQHFISSQRWTEGCAGLVEPQHPYGSSQDTLAWKWCGRANPLGQGLLSGHQLEVLAQLDITTSHLYHVSIQRHLAGIWHRPHSAKGRSGSDTQQRGSRVMSPKAGTVIIH